MLKHPSSNKNSCIMNNNVRVAKLENKTVKVSKKNHIFERQ